VNNQQINAVRLLRGEEKKPGGEKRKERATVHYHSRAEKGSRREGENPTGGKQRNLLCETIIQMLIKFRPVRRFKTDTV